MPVGLVIMTWDDRSGTEVLVKYPEEINISDNVLMQIYSTHEYSGELGMVSLMVGSLNIASYYTGPEISLYIILLLSLDDDPDAYEGGMADLASKILQHYGDDSYLEMIPSLFRRLSVYPTITEEQKLAITYKNEIARLIINRLREEGIVSKSELKVWLKDNFKKGFVDLDSILMELFKRDIIRETSIRGMSSEFIFLTNDIIMSRFPPIKLLKDPAEYGLPKNLINDYLTVCNSFFENYKPSEEDNLIILELLIDPQLYEVLKLFRTSIVTRNELEKLKKKGVDDIDYFLKKLWDNQLIQVFQDARGNEYYGLITDFYLDKIFPEYMLNVIKSEYIQKTKPEKVLIEYLNVLEDTFLSLFASDYE